MKRWLLLLVASATLWFVDMPCVQAQKVHVLVVGDVSPSAGWGQYTANVAMDLTRMYVVVHENVPESQIEYLSFQMMEDEDSDPKQILEGLAMLKPGSNDTLFVYFTGHGGADDQGHHLLLAKGKLYRQKLIDAMLAKKPRLAVLITDCCNSRSDGYNFVAAAPYVNEPKSVTPLFSSLMIEPKGLVDINSSSPGQSSFFTPLEHDPPGSIFSFEFAKWADLHKNRKVSWNEMVHDVSLQVHTAFKAFYPKGAQVAKGAAVQTEQSVFAITYPGQPEKEGPRTGFVVRDFPGRGVVITEIAAKSPATQVFDANSKKFLSLQAQQVVTSVNGNAVSSVETLVSLIKESPQIMRIGIRDAKTGVHEYLLRMRY